MDCSVYIKLTKETRRLLKRRDALEKGIARSEVVLCLYCDVNLLEELCEHVPTVEKLKNEIKKLKKKRSE